MYVHYPYTCMYITPIHVCTYTGLHTRTVYSTSSLFQQAVKSGNYCLTEWGKTNVQVALAALELIGGLADLQIEDISTVT